MDRLFGADRDAAAALNRTATTSQDIFSYGCMVGLRSRQSNGIIQDVRAQASGLADPWRGVRATATYGPAQRALGEYDSSQYRAACPYVRPFQETKVPQRTPVPPISVAAGLALQGHPGRASHCEITKVIPPAFAHRWRTHKLTRPRQFLLSHGCDCGAADLWLGFDTSSSAIQLGSRVRRQTFQIAARLAHRRSGRCMS
jgi:hypothetical protein